MGKTKQGASKDKQPEQTTPDTRLKFTHPLILLMVVLVAFTAVGAVGIMSDMSIHGLTLKFYNASRYCAAGTVTFSFSSVVVYSSNSLPVSLHQVSFALSADGVQVATSQAPDSSFGTGQSAQYSSLVFANAGLDPHSQPSSSTIDLTINAQVSAGLFSSPASASVSQVVNFGAAPC